MYEAAKKSLDEAFQRFLVVADEARESGTPPDPPPEVVALAMAGEAVWWRVRRGDKSSEDRYRRRLHSQIDDLLQVARSRFGVKTAVEPVEGLRWRLYDGGPKAGFAGYLERIGDDAPEGLDRVPYWLAADGSVMVPASLGFPPGGEVEV